MVLAYDLGFVVPTCRVEEFIAMLSLNLRTYSHKEGTLILCYFKVLLHACTYLRCCYIYTGSFCDSGRDNCNPRARCIDTPGSFICLCNSGFTGDGVTCSGTYIYAWSSDTYMCELLYIL